MTDDEIARDELLTELRGLTADGLAGFVQKLLSDVAKGCDLRYVIVVSRGNESVIAGNVSKTRVPSMLAEAAASIDEACSN